MPILSSVPVLTCHSILQTQDFYQQLLQFVTVNKREAEGQLQWVHLMHSDTALMLEKAESGLKAESEPVVDDESSKISLYFIVDDIEALHHRIKLKHPSVSDITHKDYRMKEFAMHDPEGNRVVIGQADG
jgi:catechol 2,3-dioxygenase-like lactoylglutathione lyase family enzyme